MSRYREFFYNSERFFFLRAAGWLIGLAVAILFAVFWRPAIALFVGIITSIIVDIFFFKIKGLKESAYKNIDVLTKKFGVAPETFDKYASSLTWAKPSALALITLFCFFVTSDHRIIPTLMVSSIFYLPLMSFVVTFIVSYFCGMTIPTEEPAPQILWYYGVPGYNFHGVYTGSPTAIGGISN